MVVLMVVLRPLAAPRAKYQNLGNLPTFFIKKPLALALVSASQKRRQKADEAQAKFIKLKAGAAGVGTVFDRPLRVPPLIFGTRSPRGESATRTSPRASSRPGHNSTGSALSSTDLRSRGQRRAL
jgi:hypothetical protein